MSEEETMDYGSYGYNKIAMYFIPHAHLALIITLCCSWFSSCWAQQWVSPCPDLFTYDPEGVVGDRWWSTISVTPDSEFAGLWLRVVMDRPFLELGTDFGESLQREPAEFLIRKPKQRLPAGETLRIRVFARFAPGTTPPQLLGLRLNGRVVCPESGVIEVIETTQAPALVSPCPTLFSYEPPNSETDRWYGTIELQSERELSGVWLRVILDRPSIQLGNWFGEVTTDDNKEYLIKNRQMKVRPGESVPVRFFVKYNPAEPVPKLERFRLNAVDVCPSGVDSSGGSGQFSTEAPVRPQAVIPESSNGNRRGGPNWITPDTGPKPDSSIFGSDFDPQSRPTFLPGRDTTSSATCGTVAAIPRPLITHGKVAGEAQWPWHAALYYPKGIDLQYICGASLVSLRHVLSAAHCVTKKSSNQPVANDDVEVYLGKYHLRKFTGKGIQNMQVSRVIVHPEYNHRYYANDIALLGLIAPVEFTDYVRPVCLWNANRDINEVVDKEGTVVGWGYDHTGKVTETLTKATMPVVSHPTCIWSYPEFFSKFANDRTFCAGFKNGTSVCNGDSGGGLVFPKANSNPNQPVWQIRGIVSISVALQSEFICDTSHYAIFTDVAKYLDWIKQNMV